MNTQPNNSFLGDVSLGKAALIAGLGLLLMVLTAPVAEMYLLPKLVDFNDPDITFQNITENRQVFITVIFLYLTTFLADVVVAWALYIFFIPVSKSFSLLTAWFRLVYTALAIIGLFNLLKVLTLTKNQDALSATEQDALADQVIFYLKSFGQEWGIAFIFFGIYLVLLGLLAYRATYVPKIMGILLIIGGLGYFTSSLKPYFFPNLDTTLLMITFFGELVFMIWLLIKGWRVEEQSG